MLKKSYLENTMSKNKGMVIVSKEVAYWTNIVKNLKNAIDIDEKALRWNKACLDLAELNRDVAISEDK